MSILAGGIAFETPASGSPLPPAEAGATYDLFDNRNAAFRPPVRDPHTYLLVFRQSVRGLEVGAPVMMDGVTIGEVTQINPQFDTQKAEFTVPVIISVDPLRYGVKFLNLPDGGDAIKNNIFILETLVSHGLSAQLKTGSLISGSLYVAVDLFPDEPPATLDWSQNPVQLPTRSGSIEAIEDSVGTLLKNLDKAVTKTRGTLTNADSLDAEPGQDPRDHARGTLTNADKVINNAGTLIAPDSVFNAELINLLQQGGGAAQSLRVLADYLRRRHPEALIRGKTGERLNHENHFPTSHRHRVRRGDRRRLRLLGAGPGSTRSTPPPRAAALPP